MILSLSLSIEVTIDPIRVYSPQVGLRTIIIVGEIDGMHSVRNKEQTCIVDVEKIFLAYPLLLR